MDFQTEDTPRKGSKSKTQERPNYFYDEPNRERIYHWAKRRFEQNQSRFFNHARLYLFTKEVIFYFIMLIIKSKYN